MTQGSPHDFVIERVRLYAASVEQTYAEACTATGAHFPDRDRLLSRFRKAVADFESSRSHVSAIDETHNELCVAIAMLRGATVRSLNYEPSLRGSRKTIDFRAELADGQVIFVDVKNIRPDATNRWEQYERALEEGWFPPNVTVDLAEDALGGEIWHDMFAARERILQYTLELEQKIAEFNAATANTRFVLALCSDGFRWGQDELEDFVAFYTTGRHRSDDSFARIERDYIRKQALDFSRAVHRFAWICRPPCEVHATEINWNVQPPEDPALLGE